ncbi:lipoyl(octanoyl) transferase LipB [Pseudarthrobacter sp. P1]|uniref:lipoyl(octanoyl) transferase LipB n=1 Tax=Pseudarthrobacter sp. P1 TaxID=3418418 RepID=UPI003CF24A48
MTLEYTEVGLAPKFVDYMQAWDIQRGLHEDVVAGSAPSTVLFLEHAAVYTAGKRTEDHERPFDGTPVIAVDRGGKLTWHGPGQLVAYPIVKLKDPHGIREYVWVLEDIIISTLASVGLTGTRVDRRAGIWIEADERGPTRKIAAIGIRVHNGVTMHGIAINANNDLAPYGQIIACGISDAGTTTIAAETGRDISPADLLATLIEEFRSREDALVGIDDTTRDGGSPESTTGTEAELSPAEGAAL